MCLRSAVVAAAASCGVGTAPVPVGQRLESGITDTMPTLLEQHAYELLGFVHCDLLFVGYDESREAH